MVTKSSIKKFPKKKFTKALADVFFAIQFNKTERALNQPLVHSLKRKKGEYRVYTIDELVQKLENFSGWQDHIQTLLRKGVVYSRDQRISFKLVKLRDIRIDDDIQRSLDPAHCVSIGNPETFKVSFMSSIQCVKLPGKEEYHSINAQHTLVLEAAYAYRRIWNLPNLENYLDMEVPVSYVETSNRADARKAFKVYNGKGGKRISQYHEHFQNTIMYRVDGDGDKECFQAHELQSIMEELDYEFQSDDLFDPNIGHPRCITHVSASRKYYGKPNHWRFILTMHDKYWPNQQLSGMEIDLYGLMYEYMNKIADVYSEEFQSTFLDPVHAIIQQFFFSPQNFGVESGNTYRRWYSATYSVTEKDAKVEAQGSFVLLLKMYKNMNGTQPLPSIVDLYDNTVAGDVTSYLPDHIQQNVAKYA